MYDFCIIGNDKRYEALANSLKLDGYCVRFFDENTDITCSYLLLPIPVFNKENNLNIPSKISLKDALDNIEVTEKIFGGGEVDIPDYHNLLKDEEFAIKNAILTAESTISVIHSISDKAIFKSRCLVIGNGRIGKILSSYLNSLKADVTVSARKISDLAWVEACGYKSVLTKTVPYILGEYDFIFNTVDCVLLDKNDADRIKDGSMIIDLASYPGIIRGEDEAYFGNKYIRALGLPGKILPESAGEIIKDILIRCIKKEGT